MFWRKPKTVGDLEEKGGLGNILSNPSGRNTRSDKKIVNFVKDTLKGRKKKK